MLTFLQTQLLFPPMPRILFILLLTFPLLSCDRSSATAAAPDARSAAPREVRLGYFANVTHAQAVLGVSSGEFAQAIAPRKLTTRVFNAGPSLIEALFAD